ncbi:MAG: N-formylglutamate amidohydrolase [Deltaproteobacteria bacterium]|nr:MAG: N-formylglutamate amidohydrolase [Deltaproteobacteria bacterium]
MRAREPAVVSCEHGGNRVPARWRPLFAGAAELLASHRGWDPGSLVLARRIARALGRPLLAHRVTRLLADANRSRHHPRLFSELTRGLPASEREGILTRCWAPHRARVEAELARRLRRGRRVFHLSVHSFTPVLHGVDRETDLALLYDPARRSERALCARWSRLLRAAAPDLRVRRNHPYRGVADGLTTTLRRRFGPRYLGIELEVSQSLAANEPARIGALVIHTLRELGDS